MELNTVYNMDCFQGLQRFTTDREIIVITDPPFPNGRDLFEDTIYDGYSALYYLCKRAQIIIFFWSNIGIPVPPTGWYETSRHIWHKPNGQSATYYENIIIWKKEDKRGQSKVWRIPIINYQSLPEWEPHPTQKPLRLMMELVHMYAKKGSLVIDPFAGSGSTLVACKRQGISFLGFEIDPVYTQITQRRLSQTTEQKKIVLEEL